MKSSQILVLVLVTLIPSLGFGQWEFVHKGVDFLPEIKRYNLSTLWRSNSIVAWGDEDFTSFPFPEPLGFIGADYQRFYIHLISVRKSPNNSLLYLVHGKTRVRNTIRSFHGTILVTSAILDIVTDEHIVDDTLPFPY